MDHARSLENVLTISPRAIKIIVVAVVFLTLGLFSVALRIWARKIKGQALMFNDYAMLAALVEVSFLQPFIHEKSSQALIFMQLFTIGDFVTTMMGGFLLLIRNNRC